MQENNTPFQDLQIFESPQLNSLCDRVASKVRDLTGEELAVCGSLAKIFAGELSEDYTPKDIDFIVSPWGFRKLLHRLHTIEAVTMIEKLPHKIILYADGFFCIEIWFKTKHNEAMSLFHYKQLIPYLYGDKIKTNGIL